MDAMRRGGLRTSGFMNWVFNEPWSNGAGNTVVDYDGRPLMNYHLARQALAPISLSLKFDSLRYKPDEGLRFEVWLTSDSPSPAKALVVAVAGAGPAGQGLCDRSGHHEH